MRVQDGAPYRQALPDRGAGSAGHTWARLAAFYAASFSALGVFLQFFPAWMHDVQGFSEREIAVVLSAVTLARTIAGPLWAQAADRSGDARRVLSLLSAGSVGAFALFAFAPSLVGAWCVALVFGCLYPPMHSIVDAAAVREGAQHGFSFGRLRLVGSLSFLVAILAVGAWLERSSTSRVYGILLGCLLATAAAGRCLPRGPRASHIPDARPAPWWHLLRSTPFVVLLICSALIQGSHAVYYQLSTVYWGEHGVATSVAATLWAEGVLAEIVLFYFARHTLDRLRPTTLLLLGGLGATVRWLVLGATTDVPILFAANWLHALSFAATYLGAIRALDGRVPDAQLATAQGMTGAATAGGGMVLCGLCGGFVSTAFEGAGFCLMAVFAALGSAAALWLRTRRDR